MWSGCYLVIDLLVPAASISLFLPAWLISSFSQPLNYLAFLNDGVLWGTGEYAFLRNAMTIAPQVGIFGIWVLERSTAGSLSWIWSVIGCWMFLRGLFDLIRI